MKLVALSGGEDDYCDNWDFQESSWTNFYAGKSNARKLFYNTKPLMFESIFLKKKSVQL